MPHDIYFGQDHVITTRDRLSERRPLFPPPQLPSQSQALTRRSSHRRPTSAYVTEERAPRRQVAFAGLSSSAPPAPRSRPFEVPPPPVLHQRPRPASSRPFEVPPPPLIPQYQPQYRFVIPPAQEPPLVGPAPDPPSAHQRRGHRRQQSSSSTHSTSGSSNAPASPGLRLGIPQTSGNRRRAGSSAASLSPSSLDTPHSGRSTRSRHEDERPVREGEKAPKRLEEGKRVPPPWRPDVFYKNADGSKVSRYYYG